MHHASTIALASALTGINRRMRGVVYARAERHREPGSPDVNTTISALTTAFADFKKRHEDELDDINARLAAGKIGGMGPSSGEGGGPDLRRARSALGDFARSGSMAGSARAAMSTDSGPDGGFVVAPELERQITRHQRDLSAMRRLARVVSSSSSDYSIPVASGGVECGWVAERQARPETEGAQLSLKNYPAHEVYANPAVTQTLLDDAPEDIGAFLSDEIAQAFDATEGSAFINGDGINKPRGFLTYAVTGEPDGERGAGKLQYVVSGAAGGFAASDPGDALIDLVYTLRAPYRAGAVWLMNSKTAGTIRKFKDADGNYIWSVADRPGDLPMLLGYPVEIDEDMPDVSVGSTPVAFGNFRRGYVIVDRTGVRLLRDALTNKPYVHFYTTKRVGGGVWQDNAIKLLKISAS
ncbi:MAG: phage major capsid protein [Brevundimonas sp.]|uniref:phage major capsid protein n=1 Tax=Brevundimonas sp. TaxID=1871086 RepID=UPI001A22BAA4|nr:phage major capsid protein [Brevundimonas sp.]MBJ7319338.1 phage major capsid protein [Brevundimonas sp.]